MLQAALSIDKKNKRLAIKIISWLSQLNKKNSLMVVYLKYKTQADMMLARKLIEVEGKNATTQI